MLAEREHVSLLWKSMKQTSRVRTVRRAAGKSDFVLFSLTVRRSAASDAASKTGSANSPRGASAALDRPPLMNIDYKNNTS